MVGSKYCISLFLALKSAAIDIYVINMLNKCVTTNSTPTSAAYVHHKASVTTLLYLQLDRNYACFATLVYHGYCHSQTLIQVK